MISNAYDEMTLQRTKELHARTDELMDQIEALFEGYSLPEILFALGTLASVEGMKSAPYEVGREGMIAQSISAEHTITQALNETYKNGMDGTKVARYFGDCLAWLGILLPTTKHN